MKTLILIPCYNTHIYIDNLLTQLRLHASNDILVIDDGSSPALSIDFNKHKSVFLVRNNNNMGKGYSIKKTLKFAKLKNYSNLVTIDGDMQHDPSEIIQFISCGENYDFVLGARKFKFPMPFHRRISNWMTSFIISSLISQNVKDSQCGYRKYKVDSINTDNLKENGFLLESEILLKNVNKTSKMKNININTIYAGSKSSINNISDTLNFIKLVFRYIIA